jgi:hypothetical protein
MEVLGQERVNDVVQLLSPLVRDAPPSGVITSSRLGRVPEEMFALAEILVPLETASPLSGVGELHEALAAEAGPAVVRTRAAESGAVSASTAIRRAVRPWARRNTVTLPSA